MTTGAREMPGGQIRVTQDSGFSNSKDQEPGNLRCYVLPEILPWNNLNNLKHLYTWSDDFWCLPAIVCSIEYQVEHTLVLMIDALGVFHVMERTKMMAWRPQIPNTRFSIGNREKGHHLFKLNGRNREFMPKTQKTAEAPRMHIYTIWVFP